MNLDAIKEIGLDVWEDLSRTRLAGVAIGLGLAILIIGVLLLRPTGTPNVSASSDIAAATAVPAAEDEVTFAIPGEKPLKMSNVDLSSPRDPFRSLDGMAGVDEDQTLMPADEDVQKAISTFSDAAAVAAASAPPATTTRARSSRSTTCPAPSRARRPPRPPIRPRPRSTSPRPSRTSRPRRPRPTIRTPRTSSSAG